MCWTGLAICRGRQRDEVDADAPHAPIIVEPSVILQQLLQRLKGWNIAGVPSLYLLRAKRTEEARSVQNRIVFTSRFIHR